MAITPLPPNNDTSWTDWATDIDTVARSVDDGDFAPVDHAHSLPDLPSMVGAIIIETSTGVWSNSVPVRTSGTNPIIFVSVTDPKATTNGVTGKANIILGDVWIPR